MKKWTYIYLVRHGEVDNPEKIIYGELPGFKLSQRGRLQVKKLAVFFKDIKIDAIYSSPLLRSRQTAKSILTFHKKLKVYYSKSLIEVKNKLWEGKTWIERDKRLVDIYKNTPTKINTPGLESMESLEKRMSKKIDGILKQYERGNIVVISHADTIRVAILHYQKESLDKLHERICTNASITTLVFNDGKLIQSDYKETYPCADESFWVKKQKEFA